MRQQNDTPGAPALQPANRTAYPLDRVWKHRWIVIADSRVGLLHRHLYGERRVARVGQTRTQGADHAEVRMHAYAVHEQHGSRSVLRFGIQAEKLALPGTVQPHGVTDHQRRDDFVGPALLALEILRERTLRRRQR